MTTRNPPIAAATRSAHGPRTNGPRNTRSRYAKIAAMNTDKIPRWAGCARFANVYLGGSVRVLGSKEIPAAEYSPRASPSHQANGSDEAAVHLRKMRPTGKRHRQIQFRPEMIEDGLDSIRAPYGETPKDRPAHEDGFRSERQRLEDVSPSADASIQVDFRPPGYSSHDVREDVQRSERRIELSPTMVRHDDARDAVLGRELRVLRGHDALQEDGEAADRSQPVDVLPGEGFVQQIGDILRERGTSLGFRHSLEACELEVRDSHSGWEGEPVPLVFLSPPEEERVNRQADCTVARVRGPVQEVLRHPAVAVRVELKPPRPRRRRGDLLERFRRDRADGHQGARGGRALRGGDLSLRMNEAMERGRGDEDRHRDARPEDGRGSIPLRDVDEDPGPQCPVRVCLPVPAQGDLVLRAACDVVEGRSRNLRSRHVLELEEVRERERHGPTMVSGILSVCPRRSPYTGVGRRGRGGGDSLSHDDHRHRRVPGGERLDPGLPVPPLRGRRVARGRGHPRAVRPHGPYEGHRRTVRVRRIRGPRAESLRESGARGGPHPA